MWLKAEEGHAQDPVRIPRHPQVITLRQVGQLSLETPADSRVVMTPIPAEVMPRRPVRSSRSRHLFWQVVPSRGIQQFNETPLNAAIDIRNGGTPSSDVRSLAS